jgi:serine/threonine protein kinase
MDAEDLRCVMCLKAAGLPGAAGGPILPVRLPCRHLMCRPCLEQWCAAQGAAARALACPACRTPLPGGAAALPLDEPARAIIERRARPGQPLLVASARDFLRVASPPGLRGEGTFCTVAEYRWFDLPVAVKTLKLQASDAQSREAQRGFLNEVRALGALRHPNICEVYAQVTLEGGQQGLVMALHRSGSLEALLHPGGHGCSPATPRHPLGLQRAVRLGIDVARGLAYAHSVGVTHNDIKSGNVLLAEDGRAVLADFGLVRKIKECFRETFQSCTTAAGDKGILGTAVWSAPENLRGAKPGEAATARGQAPGDVYSLGLLLLEMVTGVAPWAEKEGWGLAEVVSAVLVDGERPEIPAAVDPRLAALVRRCTVAEAAARPTAAAVLTELVAIADTLPPPPPSGVGDLDKLRALVALGRELEIRLDFVISLRQLEEFDVVFLCDDSGSMNEIDVTDKDGNVVSRWATLKNSVGQVMRLACALDQDGVDCFFLKRGDFRNVNKAQELEDAFAAIPTCTTTPLCAALRRIAAAHAAGTKPVLVVVATDGIPCPAKDGETQEAFFAALKALPQKFHVSMLACTDKKEAIQWMDGMDGEATFMEGRYDVMSGFAGERAQIMEQQNGSVDYAGQPFSFTYGDCQCLPPSLALSLSVSFPLPLSNTHPLSPAQALLAHSHPR